MNISFIRNIFQKFKAPTRILFFLILFITISIFSVNAKENIEFSVSKMRNDVTGNFRIATISKNIQMKDYALEYYNKYFKNDNEIHAIVNFSNMTTTAISDFGLGFLDVTVHEYVKKEEHDAKIIFSGMVLSEYYINKTTGKIEKIQ